MVEKVDPYTITIDNKDYELNYKIKFIDLGRSFVIPNVDKEDMQKVAKHIIQIFKIKSRAIPSATLKCSQGKTLDYMSFGANIIKSFVGSVPDDNIDLHFVKELFNIIYKTICVNQWCNTDIDIFNRCQNIDDCVQNPFFDDIIRKIGGNPNKSYYKYAKYKNKYLKLKKFIN